MTLRLLAAAVAAAALAGLAGCDRNDPDRTTSGRSTTTTPPESRAPGAPPPTATTPPATDRTVGEATGDAAVTAKVKAALLAEKGVDGMKINVDTRDGNVVLSGNVPEPAQVERATQVARGIEGVKAVDNQLRVGAS
jgi:hyperosmotically inducible protein